jgi:type VI secretion system secreted protein VgrG
VIVEFLEGDPDKPIVTGSVYNANNTAPTLGERSDAWFGNKTHALGHAAGVRSETLGSGSDYNEVSMDDTADSEELFIRAKRDLFVHAKNDYRIKVDGTAYDYGGKTIVTGPSEDVYQGTSTQTFKEDLTLYHEANETEHFSGDKIDLVGGSHSEMVLGPKTDLALGLLFHLVGGLDTELILGSVMSMVFGGRNDVTVGVRTDSFLGFQFEAAMGGKVSRVNVAEIKDIQGGKITKGLAHIASCGVTLFV